MDSGQEKSFTVNRETVMKDMLSYYQEDIDHALSSFNVTFFGENALDLDGVKREAFSLFWNGAINAFFDGSNTFVPRISPDIEEDTYVLLGRAISHGFLLTGVIPLTINKVFLACAVYGKSGVTDAEFLEGLMELVSDYERRKLEIALLESEKGVLSQDIAEFLFDFLAEYGVSKAPTAANLRNILICVAKNELCSKPTNAAQALKKGMCTGFYDELWQLSTKESLFLVYEAMVPSTEKVVSMLKEDEPANKSQAVVVRYLKKYVRGLNTKELHRFLRYATGSSSMSTLMEIKLIFHGYTGCQPYITVHTCSGIIDLPSGGYSSFNDFRQQLDSTLQSPEAWAFSLR